MYVCISRVRIRGVREAGQAAVCVARWDRLGKSAWEGGESVEIGGAADVDLERRGTRGE